MTTQQSVLVELYLKEMSQLIGSLNYKTFGAIKFQQDPAQYDHFRKEMNVLNQKLHAVFMALMDLELQVARERVVK